VEAVRQARRTPPATTEGIWHVRTRSDSAVLKVVALRDEPGSRWPSAAEPSHPYYWRREPLAYTSGLLDALGGGLHAPRVRACVERPNGSVALWLEDVSESGGWSPARLGEVARRLGIAQAELSIDPPSHQWLSQGWLRAYVDLRRPLIEAGGERARALAGDAAATLARLDAAPQTLCHHDLHPANVLGVDASVVVDWAYCGLAAVGLDPGVLAADALLDGFVEPSDAHTVADAVWAGYANGLATGGLHGAEAEARWAFVAGTALRLSWLPGYCLQPDVDPATRDRFDAVIPLLLEWAEAARRLPSPA